LEHDEVEEAMDFYQELHKWDDSIKVAERKNHPDVKELKSNYFQWLLDTNQEGKAAEVKEEEGDYIYSIQLYLKGGLPAKAANVVFTYNMSFP
jgi:intraflagellar transport protein 172